MINLEKKGYRISIEHWVGKLGNHLIQMSGALNVARNTQSSLTIPKHPLLTRRKFDFTDSANDNCLEPLQGRFFFKSDCFQYPIVYDRDRRAIFQKYVYDVLVRRSVRDRLDALIGRKQVDSTSVDTLVINMRSGKDIFRREPPPLSSRDPVERATSPSCVDNRKNVGVLNSSGGDVCLLQRVGTVDDRRRTGEP